MKKLLALALVLCLCFSMTLVFASCEKTDDTGATTTAAENGGDEEQVPDPVILRAADCTIKNGGGEEELKIEETNSNLGYWKAGNTATWNITVKRDGKYNVKLNYAKGTTQDAEIKIIAGDKTLTARVAPTAGWEDYVDIDLGTIDLTTAVTQITIEPGEMPEADFMNLLTMTISFAE